MSRLILDISTLARWTGGAVGIVRVEHELAQHARRGAAPATFSVFDLSQGVFRVVRPEFQPVIAGFDGMIDSSSLQPTAPRRGWRRWVPGRHGLVMVLEYRRLTTRNRLTARLCDKLQRLILSVRRTHGFPLLGAAGQRLAVVPKDLALGESLAPQGGDTVLMAGADWYHKDVAQLGRLQARHGFRLATMCYDILPITHPEWFPAPDAALFERHWRQMFALADVVIVNSQAVARDVRDYCSTNGIALRSLQLVPLGSAPPVPAPAAALPPGLRAGHYALFVSTIEPRKGHAMLLEVWQKLAAAGILEARDFHLVLVGRQGWQVENEMQAIAALASGGRVRHFTKADDALLAALMTDAAFCVYPSRSEGFGLPVIEAFARGKAVLCSNGGSLPEVAGNLAPCLDPQDVAAWEAMLRRWIEQPEVVRGWEEKIRQEFSLRTWNNVAEEVFRVALDDAGAVSNIA